MTDLAALTIANTTYDQWCDFWESNGFSQAAKAYYKSRRCVERMTASGLWIALDHHYNTGVVLRLLDSQYDEPGNCFDVSTVPATVTLGEALEILNELAATRAFGGWATEVTNAEGS